MTSLDELQPQLKRIQLWALVAGAVGIAACAFGAVQSSEQFFRSYLFGFLFWFGIAAGSLNMDLVTFFGWNLIGAVVWVGFWGAGAFFFERHVTQLSAVFHHLRPIALGLAAIGVVIALRWLRRPADPSDEGAPGASR